jgi:V/A-type H+-transporting ATPase subunit E
MFEPVEVDETYKEEEETEIPETDADAEEDAATVAETAASISSVEPEVTEEPSGNVVPEEEAEAEEIAAKARKAAAELDANTRSELKLYGAQAIGALKSEVATIVTDTIVKENLDGAIKDGLLKEVILKIAEKWNSEEQLVISTAEAEELKAFFAAKAKALLDKGVEIKEVNGVKGFTVSPADGSYKVSFGAAEFESFLKSFLRPQIVELLF